MQIYIICSSNLCVSIKIINDSATSPIKHHARFLFQRPAECVIVETETHTASSSAIVAQSVRSSAIMDKILCAVKSTEKVVTDSFQVSRCFAIIIAGSELPELFCLLC